MDNKNGLEPGYPAYVYASTEECPTRELWRRGRKGKWYDEGGCQQSWESLVDPIDTLAPEGE